MSPTRSGRGSRACRALAVAAAWAALACAPREPAGPELPVLRVLARDGALAAPDTVAAGWVRLRVEEAPGGHLVVVFRLPQAVDEPELQRLLAALDTSAATPPPLLALGGPEIGDTGEVVLALPPGRHLLACVRRGADGHRHLHAGEARVLTVADAGRPSRVAPPLPRASAAVQLADFAFTGDARWPSGARLVRVENVGRQDHQMRIDRLAEGATLRDWASADDASRIATPVAGVARMGAGAVAYLPVTLPPGRYVVYCLVAEPGSRRPHVELGMFRAIQVD